MSVTAEYQANKEENANSHVPKKANIENLISQSEHIVYTNLENSESRIVVEEKAHTSKINIEDKELSRTSKMNLIVSMTVPTSYVSSKNKKKFKRTL